MLRCPKCKEEIKNQVLYKCVKCFTVYCSSCQETKEGKLCPSCGMPQRMLLTTDS